MVIAPMHSPELFCSSRVQPRDYFRGNLHYFRRGTAALAAALHGVARQQNQTTLRILLPDYFCREPLESLAKRRIVTSFYRVRQNFEPDWQHVTHLAQSDPHPDAFVLVHYFGFPNAVAEAKARCASLGITLVEDCAHMMYPLGEAGTSGIASVFSPWKFFPLPDLGLLLVQGRPSSYMETLVPSWQLRPWLQWFAKRESQRVFRSLHINWYRADQEYRTGQVPADASPNRYSQWAFSRLLGRAEWIAHRRQQNYRSLEEWFARHYPDALLFARVLPTVVPYAFPCRTKQSAAAVGRRLRQHGIPAFPWPSLPDGVRGDESQHATANWLADHVLLLPVHQDISEPQITYMQQHLALLW